MLPVTVGAILLIRLPRNLIGWLLLLSGLSFAAALGAGGLVDFALDGVPGSLPGAAWIALVAQATFLPVVVCLGLFVPLLFPSGHLPSPRWRPVALLGLIALTCGTIKNLLLQFPAGTYPSTVQNPLAVAGTAADLVSLLDTATTLIGVIALPLVVASLVIRYRRATGIERQQLKWFAYVASIAIPALVVGIALSNETSGILGAISSVAWIVGLCGFALLPVAIGVAILRYRLYDIDLIINRTIVYGLLTAILAGSYAAIVGLLQRFFIALTGSTSDAAIVLTTLVVVTLFSPIKNRLQSLVDRRFKETADRTRTLRDFAAAVESRLSPLDPDTALTRLLQVATDALEPTGGSVWLRFGDTARLVATLSAGQETGTGRAGSPVDPSDLEVSAGIEPEVRLALAPRARGAAYGERERSAMEAAVQAVAGALAGDRAEGYRVVSPPRRAGATKPPPAQPAADRRAVPGLAHPEVVDLGS